MQEGSGAFGARVQALIGLTPGATPVPPTEWAGSEGSYVVSLRWRGRCILESKRGAPAFGGQGLSPALSRGPKVV